jgi:hypothetical protein
MARGGLAGPHAAVRITEAIAVRVCVPVIRSAAVQLRIRIVRGTIAVIVEPVTDLRALGMNAWIPIVAILTGRKAVAVAVCIAHKAITIIVRRVRTVRLIRTGVEGRVGIVAVKALFAGLDIGIRLLAGQNAVPLIPVGVPIKVNEPLCSGALVEAVILVVNPAVAVIV